MIQIDIEMPESCRTCRFCQDDDYLPGYFCFLNEDCCEFSKDRPDWCPLMETEDRTWHVVAEGDLPPKLKDGKRAKTYLITKQNGRNDTRKSIDFAFWNGEAFGRERKCNIGVSGVLAWRELPEPWEGANNE